MATNEETELSESELEELPNSARQRLRELEKQVKRIPELEKQIAQRDTADTIRKSGMELNERQLKALLASHEGDDTSAEAYRKTAEELGFVEPEKETPEGAEQAHQQFADARKDAEPTGNLSYEEELNAAKSKEEVAAVAAKHGRPFGAS